MIQFIRTYCKTLQKLKNLLTFDVISNAYAFFIFQQRNNFRPHIAECANIAKKVQYHENLLAKTFNDIAPRPLYKIFNRYRTQSQIQLNQKKIEFKNRASFKKNLRPISK
jgi:hypothetical protein